MDDGPDAVAARARASAALVARLADAEGVPGVAAGFDEGGHTHLACHGVTHVEHPLPVDARTLFQIASNSKPFTATLVMALVGEGRLGLDDPVKKHLPGFRMPDPRDEEAVTVRQLLTHRVGWDGDALFVRPPEPPTLDEALAPMARARQLVPPGTHWTYSNAGFSVAGRLVEVLTGEPFARALRTRILEPLGMRRTCTRADEAIFHRVAMRHLSRPGRPPVPLPGGGWQPGWELLPLDVPAGGLVSCAEDLLRWLRFWLGRPDADATPPLPDELRLAMQEEQLPPWNPRDGQAVGWALRHDPGATVVCHGGLTAGYASFVLFAPKLDLAAVILTNGTGGASVHVPWTRWLVGEASGTPWGDAEPLEPQPALAPCEGRYWGAFGVTHVRALEGEDGEGGGALEVATERHATDDGSWQPPPEPPARARLVAARHAVYTEPAALRGAFLDFDPEHDPPRWLRTGGRIGVRMADDAGRGRLADDA